MATRGRNFNNNQDWDPMKEDFNNTTYDAQYPDDNASDGVQLDHCRLYITNIPKGLNDEGLRAAFAKFGTLLEVHVSKDPLKRYGLVSFETASEAKLAMMKMNRTEPLKLNLSIAHKPKRPDRQGDNKARSNMTSGREKSSYREDTASVGSRGRYSRKEEASNGEGETGNGFSMEDDGNMTLTDPLDASLNLELENLKLEQLKLREEQLMCKHRMLLLKQAERKPAHQGSGNTRCILPDGRIVVRNVTERGLDTRDADVAYGAGAGDSNETTLCSCKTATKSKCSWEVCSDGSSTPSTCILCSEDHSVKDKSELNSRVTSRRCTASKRSDITSKKFDMKHQKSDETCDLKFSDFYTDSEDEDETNRLIQLRNADYMDIVEEDLKVVIALAGYPKSRMRLKQMEQFQKCLNDIVSMQVKNGLLKRSPVFIDYYLNRGAIVCICKDCDTRDWIVRISAGLQDRLDCNLVLLKAKVKRLCLAVMKIPRVCWPTTAKDAFKLLQYFNPTLKTHMWRIYSQKITDDVECTSFLIDRVSGEIIRGPTFKNVIDYQQMEFELTGYTEIYYECLLSSMQEDLSSVASRVKLLEELKSEQNTPRNGSDDSKHPAIEDKEVNNNELMDYDDAEVTVVIEEVDDSENVDVKKDQESSLREDVLQKLKDVHYIGKKDEVLFWSDETNDYTSNTGCTEVIKNEEECIEADNIFSTSFVAVSEQTGSLSDSTVNLIARGSNLNIDSNRGIAYHRRTNYLHVENELKLAITLEGYPQNKLEGTHIRRLKHLFKEYRHKDMKLKRFANLIIPKFQDIYLSNGAVIYICDSLETKDYLAEVLPKFIHSTGLKLMFREITSLVRYTRIVMRLSEELAHVESSKILQKLQVRYPNLKPECWKYYSDVAGKQKREFGVDPQSLEVIKSDDFDATYEGETLSFRIIDRQKRDVSFEEKSIVKDVKKQNALVKNMYVPIDTKIMNAPLTRIRTNHYSDIIPDDLKLYLGPSNYPELRVDETLFHTIKRALEDIVFESVESNELADENVPKIHDIYLFDGVIFIICQDSASRLWIAEAVPKVNNKLNMQLKCTEFRGAVGIISMVVKTEKDVEQVIDTLQSQNPRLRTKYWRKISTVRSKTKLDVVLQIDKLSAEVITSKNFNKYIGKNAVQFKLGHLQSLIKPKGSLEELTKKYIKRENKAADKVKKEIEKEAIKEQFSNREKSVEIKQELENVIDYKISTKKDNNENISDLDPMVIEPDTNSPKSFDNETQLKDETFKVILKIPVTILPDSIDDLNIIFDLLEDKNPGLNTELWQMYTETEYPSNGKFILYVDNQSVSVIKSKDFSSYIGGEKLKFYF